MNHNQSASAHGNCGKALKHKMDGVDDMTEHETIAYLIDCTLATVDDLAGKKSRSKGEYERQKKIAQVGIANARRLGVDLSKSRAQSVIDETNGDVDMWAMEFEASK